MNCLFAFPLPCIHYKFIFVVYIAICCYKAETIPPPAEENGRKWPEMAGNGRKWPEMAGNIQIAKMTVGAWPGPITHPPPPPGGPKILKILDLDTLNREARA